MKLFRKTLLAVASITALITTASAVDNKHFESLKTFKDIKGTVTGNTLIGKNLDLYLVKGKDGSDRPFEIVVDKNGNYLVLSSKVFDVKNQKAVTIPIDVSGLKGKQAFTFGNGSKEYYVFTDPECPFCKKFEKEWTKIQDNVKFHVFFYNLDFHNEADSMTRWILNASSDEKKSERLLEIANGSISYKNAKLSANEIDEYNKIIKKQKSLGSKLGIQGVPSIMDMNGTVIAWPDLVK